MQSRLGSRNNGFPFVNAGQSDGPSYGVVVVDVLFCCMYFLFVVFHFSVCRILELQLVVFEVAVLVQTRFYDG